MLTTEQLEKVGVPIDLYESLSDEEKTAVNAIIQDFSSGSVDLYNDLYYEDFDEIPVDFNTFIVDDNYLGKATKQGSLIYDFWKTEAKKIFATDCVEVALTGAIGIGKTTAACVMLAYHMYQTMCLKNPQEFFGMRPGSKIAYAFLNNTLGSSYGVGYDTFQSLLKDSPWFLERGSLSGRVDPVYVPGKGFEIIVGSRVQHSLGKNVIGSLLDEISFAPGQNVSYEKSKVMELYRNIRRRTDSRFTVQGHNYGKLFLVSSKATESSFLEAYITDQVKKGYPIYVVDQPIWKVKPFMYSGATFKVAVGNKYVPSRIVPVGTPEEIEEYCEGFKSQGMTIIDVPIEEHQAFDQDIDKALQDIAGISTAVVTKAFNSQKVLQATSDTLRNPFVNEIISLGMNDELQLKDFFDASLIPENVIGMPVFIHLDASLSGDRTGLSAVAVIGSRQSVVESKDEDEEDEIVDELICQEVFHVGIEPPSDSEISFEKTRRFIYWLRDEVGLRIKQVTTDGFQSDDTRQILSTKGFEVGYTSLDRSPNGYDGLRSAIYDKRMMILPGDKLFEELTELERDNFTRKYDHPIYSSKDIADSLAGAHLDAMKYKDEFIFFHPDSYDYEGLNDNTSHEDKFKNDFLSSIAPVKKDKEEAPKVRRDPRVLDEIIESVTEEKTTPKVARKEQSSRPAKIDPADIFDDIYSGYGKDSNILLL